MSDLLVVQLFRWKPSRRRGRPGWLARWWRGFTRWLRWGPRRTSSDYARFMQSPEWASQRRRVLRRDAYICRWCGAKGREVHHLWYAKPSMKDTPDAGLVSLCEPCHRMAHRDKRQAPTSKRLW